MGDRGSSTAAPTVLILEALEFHPEAVDLLPGWDDEWVVFARERLRQHLLHAMESLARRLLSRCLFAAAIEVAITAVGAEPLRESAQRTLIEAYVAEGNLVEARRVYVAYKEMLMAELGVSPNVEMSDLLTMGNANALLGNTIG